MYRATLFANDPARGIAAGSTTLRMDDELIAQVLHYLEQGGFAQSAISVEAIAANGESVHVELAWLPQSSAFALRLAGLPAGVIPFDELAGAHGRQIDDNSVSCWVCLSGALDVWRRGVLHRESGLVQVFTRTPDLAFRGAKAFVADGEGGDIRLDLEAGDPACGPLRMPGSVLDDLPVSADEKNPDEAISMITNMAQAVSAFFKDCKAG